jgi:hypothetical protein
VGWVSFSGGPGGASITVETEEIRQDTQEALQSGSEVLQDAQHAVDSNGQHDKTTGAERPPATR